MPKFLARRIELMAKSRFLPLVSLILILAALAGGGMIVLNKVSPPLAETQRLVIPGCGGDLRTGIATGMFLGEGRPGDTLRGKFEIHNGGSQPLTFKLQIGCSCAQLTPS